MAIEITYTCAAWYVYVCTLSLDDDISDIYQSFSTSNCMEKVLQIASVAP